MEKATEGDMSASETLRKHCEKFKESIPIILEPPEDIPPDKTEQPSDLRYIAKLIEILRAVNADERLVIGGYEYLPRLPFTSRIFSAADRRMINEK